MNPIKPASIEAFSFRVPIGTPIKVAFGTFRDRPFVLVRVVDADGAEGWGEVWCNWPAVGAEHRARLAADIGERLIGRTFAAPDEAFRLLTSQLEVMVLQTGESRSDRPAIAGIDIALWDLAGRRRGRSAQSPSRWRGRSSPCRYTRPASIRTNRNASPSRALRGRPSRLQAQGRLRPDARLEQSHRACAPRWATPRDHVRRESGLHARFGDRLRARGGAVESAMAGGAHSRGRASRGLAGVGRGVTDSACRRRESAGQAIRRGDRRSRAARDATGHHQVGWRFRQRCASRARRWRPASSIART